MLVSNIVEAVNTKLAGERLTYNQIRLMLDETIDDINNELSAKFPDFQNLTIADDYNYFPDRYIRSVLVTGAAWKFYVYDEEGTETARQYQRDYINNLFLMKRDYSDKIPEEYQDFDKGYLTPREDSPSRNNDPYNFFRW